MNYVVLVSSLILSLNLFAADASGENCPPGESGVAKAIKPIQEILQGKQKAGRKVAQLSISDALIKLLNEYSDDIDAKREAEILEMIEDALEQGMDPNTVIDGKSLLHFIGIDSTGYADYEDEDREYRDDDVRKINKLLKLLLDKSKVKVNLSIKDQIGTSMLEKCALGVNGEAATMLITYKFKGEPAGADVKHIGKSKRYFLSYLPTPPTSEDYSYYVDFFKHIKGVGVDLNMQLAKRKNAATFAQHVARARIPDFTRKMIILGLDFKGDDKHWGPIASTLSNSENFRVIVEKGKFDLSKTINGKTILQEVDELLKEAEGIRKQHGSTKGNEDRIREYKKIIGHFSKEK